MIECNSINEKFDGSQFHHLHIMNNHAIGLFLPHKLHRSIYHNGRTGNGMKEINKAALEWLCFQEVIDGDAFNPNLGNYNFWDRGKLATVTVNNMERVAKIGKYGESFNDVLGRLLNYWETGKKKE